MNEPRRQPRLSIHRGPSGSRREGSPAQDDRFVRTVLVLIVGGLIGVFVIVSLLLGLAFVRQLFM